MLMMMRTRVVNIGVVRRRNRFVIRMKNILLRKIFIHRPFYNLDFSNFTSSARLDDVEDGIDGGGGGRRGGDGSGESPTAVEQCT